MFSANCAKITYSGVLLKLQNGENLVDGNIGGIYMKAKYFLMLILGGVFISLPAWAAPAIQNPQEYLPNTDINTKVDNIITSVPDEKNDFTKSNKFRLEKIVIKSNLKNFKEVKLRKLLKKYEKLDTDINDLNKAVSELTSFYRKNGFPAATAYLPSQKSNDGVIEIAVELGKYGNIVVENNSHVRTEIVNKMVSCLHQGDVIQGKQLETVLHNIIELGGVKAGGFMRPGASVGETDLTIRVEDGKRESYILYSENYGSKSSGRYRYGMMMDFYDFAGIGEHIGINASISNQQQHNYGILYDQVIADDGTRIGINISKTDYELGSHYAAVGAVGQATTIGVYGNTPIWKMSNSRLLFNYGWDYRKLKDELRDFDYSVEKHSNAFRFGISGMEQLPKTAINYDLTLYYGHLTGDNAHIGNMPLTLSTEGNYSKALFNANVRRALGKRWDILLKFQAQQASNNLDSSEQFNLGGANGVRAYPQGEGSGDEGYQATAELRYHTKIPGLALSTYFDAGHIKYTKNDLIPGGTTLKGWDVGVSWSENNGLWARFDYARRIGLCKDATDDAKSKQRMWFFVGKSW